MYSYKMRRVGNLFWEVFLRSWLYILNIILLKSSSSHSLNFYHTLVNELWFCYQHSCKKWILTLFYLVSNTRGQSLTKNDTVGFALILFYALKFIYIVFWQMFNVSNRVTLLHWVLFVFYTEIVILNMDWVPFQN